MFLGIRDAVGKSLGSKNRLNVVKARPLAGPSGEAFGLGYPSKACGFLRRIPMNALAKLRSAEEIAAVRA